MNHLANLLALILLMSMGACSSEEIISDEQLSKITRIVCSSDEITNVTGIEKLTNLKTLDLSINKITKI